MKKNWNQRLSGMFMISFFLISSVLSGQSEKAFMKKYLTKIPNVAVSNPQSKYRMTAVYTNRDLYGNFMDKKKISGEYTRGLENGFAEWNNVYIATSSDFMKPFTSGTKQEYIENFKYVPSSEMLSKDAFKGFPPTPESVYAKNLIWDMLMIENFARDYSDSLRLNKTYIIPEISGAFEMENIGNYSQISIQICWTGVSVVNGKMCAVLEYRALDNKIELSMDQLKTRGTEQYWGTTWVALDDKQVEYAEVYGGTLQEIEITGMQNKFLVKTIRELWVERIQ
ncbi:MAG: hypothetical protein IPJ16_18155 [Bacteroidales bacterium]|nr:hypothetical protein [Bacteroidales bacterium]